MDNAKAKAKAEEIVDRQVLRGLDEADRKYLIDDIANQLQSAYYEGHRDGSAHADAQWIESTNRK